jgi:hypothetical protein
MPRQPLNLGSLEGFPHSRASPLFLLAERSPPLLPLQLQCRRSKPPMEPGPEPPAGRVGASAAARSGVKTKRRTRQRRHRFLGGVAAPWAAATRRPWRHLRLRPPQSPSGSAAPLPSSRPPEGWLPWPPPTPQPPRPRP